jgi:hypothetical protein
MSGVQCSDEDLRAAVEAFDKTGSKRAAAALLGIPRNTLRGRLFSAAARGISSPEKTLETLHGFNPEHDLTHVVPSPMVLRGTSTLYNKEGNVQLQWVKTKLDDLKAEEAMRAAIQVLSQAVDGLAPISKAPTYACEDLLVVYPLGDPHIGMYSWAKETGEAFDLDIAKRVTLGAVDRLVSSAPGASTAIILPLGDVFHSDDQTNVTPGHSHQLDVDSRFVKVLGIGIEVFRHMVLRALEKHDKVIVRFVAGNHDPHSIWALAFTIAAYFSKESRVEVDLSPSKFWFYRFGEVLIGSTHGDLTKTETLLGVMATDRAKDWGDTKYRYWYTGHVHHSAVKELPGVVCESFRTLAAKDAYAAGHGYRAGRDMVCIVHHKKYGEIERHRCDIGMLE